MSTVSVQRAQFEDIPCVVRLWRMMLDFHLERDERFRLVEDAQRLLESHLEQSLLRDDHLVAVAMFDSEVVGYVHAAVLENLEVFAVRRYGLVADLMVKPEIRRRGVGLALWGFAQEWFRQQAISCIQLNVSELNPEAQEFWRACGFNDFLKVMWCDLD